MTVVLTLEVILCLFSDVFLEKLKLFMTLPVPSGKLWAGSKGFFPGATAGFLRMRLILCPFWIYGTSETSRGGKREHWE